MPWWMLLTFLMFVWCLVAFGALVGLWADRLEGKKPPGGGVRIAPVIPLVPLVMFAVAKGFDLFWPFWGTRIIGILHGGLAALFVVLILRDILRGLAAERVS
jgi:hypothetical protein